VLKNPRISQKDDSSVRPVTMETVARLAGVSQVTVSRALNDPDKVSPATLARIRQAISITGYVPNLVAGALASKRSKLIAALIPSITNIVYSSLMQHFSEAVRSSGYQLLMSETGFSQMEEQALVAKLLTRRPDAVLLTGVHHSSECRRMLLGAGIPVVEVWDITETPIDTCVGFSHTGAGRAVAEFIVRNGYRRAANVSAGDERALRRKDAFAKALMERGFESVPEVCFEGGASIERGRLALARLVNEHAFRHGVIYCSSDLLAHGVLIEALARGLSVPSEIAVVGFGDQVFAPHTLPPLTTVRVDRALLGRKAAEALLTRLNGETVTERTTDIGFEIVRRETA
jgi:LacI family gluconate utilization system Gnt-I transcriptional repressor